MRRTVVGISGVALVCGVVLVVCLVVGLRLMEASRLFGDQGADLEPGEAEKGRAMASAGYELVTVAAPLAGGILFAVIVILALLAFRWELRRAAPPAAA